MIRLIKKKIKITSIKNFNDHFNKIVICVILRK